MWRRGNDDDELIATFMRELAATPVEERSRVDPSVLWWKAQLLRRWDAEQQVTRPLEVGERVQILISLCGAFLLLPWMWRALQGTPVGLTLIALTGISGLVIGFAAMVTAWKRFAGD